MKRWEPLEGILTCLHRWTEATDQGWAGGEPSPGSSLRLEEGCGDGGDGGGEEGLIAGQCGDRASEAAGKVNTVPDGRTERPAGGAAGAGSRAAPCRAAPEPRTAGNPAMSGQNPRGWGPRWAGRIWKSHLISTCPGGGVPTPASFLRVSPPGEVSTLNSRSCKAWNSSGG